MKNYTLIKIITASILLIGCFYVEFAFAQGGDLGEIAKGLVDTVKDFATLVTASSYLAGLAMAVFAIFQFKAYRDNPQSTTIGKPIVYLLVATALLFLPGIFKAAGASLGLSSDAGTISGFTEIDGD